ncbi:peptidoglycan-associated lipoprotein precursor [Halobacteriovorax marinus SJ]|uniref:Peptidoglycan-associated lipoprotein n=1 Tax=Halobacteriovorax marinus (strain ATCC BAA-682 / DSM 15412 / SJ) TaxID=862908 RepID=E1X5R6_HALMS|nr:peptidoglycan-associated lipoprotein Pal [Halobacteriovorax marinus]CBW25633.1 peptidoglycan-associated lipoprotein precursor [Halobacteriovorax marinus SJ]
MKFTFKPMTLLAVLTLSLSLASCSSTKKKEVNDNQTMESVGADASALELNADSDSGKAGPIKTVFFGFNSSVLSTSARETLNANAEFLKANPSVEIQVEGHCDERGGVQYNLALGERRAVAVKDHLVAMGVNSSRISTISFGKERPVAFGHDESAWASNRRGNFIITAK